MPHQPAKLMETGTISEMSALTCLAVSFESVGYRVFLSCFSDCIRHDHC